MKFGIILETNAYEKAWNAFRLGIAARRSGHEVKMFLMGEAVECEGRVHETFNVDEQLKLFVKEGGSVLACGTCLKFRQMSGLGSCSVSTMNDCVNMVEWADRVLTF
jgi:sulfur relay (sulfurtransferase) complex TusBCD TusD component (DsrE family)